MIKVIIAKQTLLVTTSMNHSEYKEITQKTNSFRYNWIEDTITAIKNNPILITKLRHVLINNQIAKPCEHSNVNDIHFNFYTVDLVEEEIEEIIDCISNNDTTSEIESLIDIWGRLIY